MSLTPKRENLCPYHMGFHSVGERHAGRSCPGKDLALEMLIDVIVTVGQVRRSAASDAIDNKAENETGAAEDELI